MIDDAQINEAIILDEVGLASARYRQFHLKSVVQPIYRLDRDACPVWGLDARLRAFRDGRAVSSFIVAESITAHDIPFFEMLCHALQIENYDHYDVAQAHLFCSMDAARGTNPAALRSQLRSLSTRMENLGIAPHLLSCGVVSSEQVDSRVIQHLAKSIAAHGFATAIDDFAAGFPPLEHVERLQPGLMRMNGAWFRRVAGVAQAAGLLHELVQGFRRMGIAILISGIETSSQFELAVQAGALFGQGLYLAPSQLAGTIIPATPLYVQKTERMAQERDQPSNRSRPHSD